MENELQQPTSLLSLGSGGRWQPFACTTGVICRSRSAALSGEQTTEPLRAPAARTATRSLPRNGRSARPRPAGKWQSRAAPWLRTAAGSGPQSPSLLLPPLSRGGRSSLVLTGTRVQSFWRAGEGGQLGARASGVTTDTCEELRSRASSPFQAVGNSSHHFHSESCQRSRAARRQRAEGSRSAVLFIGLVGLCF